MIFTLLNHWRHHSLGFITEFFHCNLWSHSVNGLALPAMQKTYGENPPHPCRGGGGGELLNTNAN